MTLRYKDDEKTIRVPNGVATRVLVGRNGFEPPM
jgi:hypothetical protein